MNKPEIGVGSRIRFDHVKRTYVVADRRGDEIKVRGGTWVPIAGASLVHPAEAKAGES